MVEQQGKGLESIAKDVHEIKTALIGNKDFQQPGLIDEVNDLKIEVASQKLEIENIKKKDLKMTAYISALITTLILAGGKLLGKLGIILAALPK